MEAPSLVGRATVSVARDKTAQIERLMGLYGDKVMHLAYFYVKDRGIAEDIAQEVFLKVYRNLDCFRGESSWYTWLYRITVNQCHDYLRSWSYRNVTVVESHEFTETTPNTEEQAISSLRGAEILEKVMGLPPSFREVITLRYYHDLSNSEIAEILGEKEGTVRSRLHRARNLLRTILEEEVT